MEFAVEVALNEVFVCCPLNGALSHGARRHLPTSFSPVLGECPVVEPGVVVEPADDMWAVAAVVCLAQQSAATQSGMWHAELSQHPNLSMGLRRVHIPRARCADYACEGNRIAQGWRACNLTSGQI